MWPDRVMTSDAEATYFAMFTSLTGFHRPGSAWPIPPAENTSLFVLHLPLGHWPGGREESLSTKGSASEAGFSPFKN